jgi:hypothetical protein
MEIPPMLGAVEGVLLTSISKGGQIHPRRIIRATKPAFETVCAGLNSALFSEDTPILLCSQYHLGTIV